MEQKRSLTPAQIQYLKIGPKVAHSTTSTLKLQEQLAEFEGQGGKNLNNVSKFTYGNFQNTVNNFGVLLHRNFIGTTTLHQVQKFGKLAAPVDTIMQADKDRPVEKGKAGNKKLIDTRTSLKAIYEYKGHKLLLVLHSFCINSVQTSRTIETLPLPYLKLMTAHITGSKLVRTMENAMRQQGSTISIQYDKMESKVNQITNSEISYTEGPYILEKSSHQFEICLPYLQVSHPQFQFKQSVIIENKDILEILECDFDNSQVIGQKYINFTLFEEHLGKTGVQRQSIPHTQ